MHPVNRPRITNPYGKPNKRYLAGYHTGIDYGCRVGTRVKSIANGKVIQVFTSKAYGNVVVVRSKKNNKFYRNYYCHLSAAVAKKGQRVKEGEVIALSGNTGNSTGPHLHLETRVRPFGYRNNVKNPFIDDPKAFYKKR
jgi:murein DD-endopeptidase MepM/ murein hydrolase activator NlpD